MKIFATNHLRIPSVQFLKKKKIFFQITSFPLFPFRNKALQKLGGAYKKVLSNWLINLANEPQLKATHLKFANFNLKTYC